MKRMAIHGVMRMRTERTTIHLSTRYPSLAKPGYVIQSLDTICEYLYELRPGKMANALLMSEAASTVFSPHTNVRPRNKTTKTTEESVRASDKMGWKVEGKTLVNLSNIYDVYVPESEVKPECRESPGQQVVRIRCCEKGEDQVDREDEMERNWSAVEWDWDMMLDEAADEFDV